MTISFPSPHMARSLQHPALQGAGLQDLLPSVSSGSPASFQDLLLKSVGETNTMSLQANQSVQESLLGGELTMIESMTSLRKADLALRLLMQVRNKLVAAYNEVQQMQV